MTDYENNEPTYDLKWKVKILKKLLKFDLNLRTEKDNKSFAMDLENVMMVIAKTPRAKNVMEFIPLDDEPRVCDKIPELYYRASKKNELCMSKYSMEYLKKIFDFFNECTESLTMALTQDYPGCFYNEDWEIILAPRCEGDDGITARLPDCHKELEKKKKVVKKKITKKKKVKK